MAVAAAAGEPLRFQPTRVTLRGHFEIVLRMGPPNYGETPKSDARLEVPILFLPSPIRIDGTPGDPIDAEPMDDVRVIQLLLPGGEDRYRFIDEDVRVVGELSHATRGPEFFPVVMNVRSIQLAEDAAK